MKRKAAFILIPLVALALVLMFAFPFVTRLVSRLPFHSLTAKVGSDRVTSKAPYLSSTEQEIIEEVNLARANPREYASYLEELKKHFNGKNCQRQSGLTVTTNEGVTAVDEAINFLRSANPLPPLEVSKGMFLGAKAHVSDMGPKGSVGHKGTDASFVEQRVSRFGSWHDAIGETIAYDKGTARDIVMGFIVDDGAPNRGHRKAVFSPNYHVAGVACGDHTTAGKMCVVTYAGGFNDGTPQTGARQTVATKF